MEFSLASDLVNAGLVVVLDRWENARIGSSVPKFVERIVKCDHLIVVGTPLYRTKYENSDPTRGFVAAAEGDLIGRRMIGSERAKLSVSDTLAIFRPARRPTRLKVMFVQKPSITFAVF